MLARAVKNAAPEDLAGQIRDQIATAQARVVELQRQQTDAAEASIASPAAVADYERLAAAGIAAAGEVVRLEKALAAVEAKALEAVRQRQLAEQAALRARVAKILGQRLEVSKRFSAHLKETVQDFRELVQLSEQAYAAYPRTFGEPSDAAALGNTLLVQLVAAEMFRVGHVIPTTGQPVTGRSMPSLPGPKASYEFLELPESIKPLADEIAAANQLAIANMEGRAS